MLENKIDFFGLNCRDDEKVWGELSRGQFEALWATIEYLDATEILGWKREFAQVRWGWPGKKRTETDYEYLHRLECQLM